MRKENNHKQCDINVYDIWNIHIVKRCAWLFIGWHDRHDRLFIFFAFIIFKKRALSELQYANGVVMTVPNMELAISCGKV